MNNKKSLFDLSGKIAIITGGTGLLGTQFAEALAEFGAHPVIIDLDQQTCETRASYVSEKYGAKALGIKADITSKESVSQMTEKVLEKFAKIDILINNAAIWPEGYYTPFEEYPLELWEKVMSVNLTGAFICSQVIGTQMVKQGYGNIINIASIYGIAAPDQRIYKGSSINTPAIYSASKGGILGLTRYLATYWADKGIRVNSVSPGGVFDGQEEGFVKNYSHRAPLGRMADKAELKGAILYLASAASSYVTGHNLVVDGGWTVW